MCVWCLMCVNHPWPMCICAVYFYIPLSSCFFVFAAVDKMICDDYSSVVATNDIVNLINLFEPKAYSNFPQMNMSCSLSVIVHLISSRWLLCVGGWPPPQYRHQHHNYYYLTLCFACKKKDWCTQSRSGFGHFRCQIDISSRSRLVYCALPKMLISTNKNGWALPTTQQTSKQHIGTFRC